MTSLLLLTVKYLRRCLNEVFDKKVRPLVMRHEDDREMEMEGLDFPMRPPEASKQIYTEVFISLTKLAIACGH